MLGIAKVIFDLVQFGHQVRSSSETTRLLEQLNETAKSMDQNMERILVLREESSAPEPEPLHPTLMINCERAGALAEKAAMQGSEAKKVIQAARRRFDFHLTQAKDIALSTSFADMQDLPVDQIQDKVNDYKILNYKTQGQLRRFQAVSETEMIVVHAVTLENGWAIVLQEGNFSRISVVDTEDERTIYEHTSGSNLETGSFSYSKMTGKDGKTANYSTGYNSSGPNYPRTESENYYFSGDIHENPEDIVGVYSEKNEEKEFIDTYEGEFAVAITDNFKLLGQEAFVAEIFRNGFGVRTIRAGKSYWWHKGEFENGTPKSYGITSDSERGEHLVQLVEGAEVVRIRRADYAAF